MADPGDLGHWERTVAGYGYLMAQDALPLIEELRAARAEVKRLRLCAMCDGIHDPFIRMVGLCYRHTADVLRRTEEPPGPEAACEGPCCR